MVVSTKGRYALRVMIDLTQHQSGEYIPLKEIADRQGISEKYLEAILKILVTSGMVVGLRGKGGGYRLNVDPTDCTAWDVISITEGDGMVPVACLEEGAATCPRASSCETLPMWKEFNTTIKNFFNGYTIADLAETSKDQYTYMI